MGIIEQQLHDGGVAALGRLDERAGVVLELAEGVGVARQQELDHVGVAARARQRQRRVVAVGRHAVHVGALDDGRHLFQLSGFEQLHQNQKRDMFS